MTDRYGNGSLQDRKERVVKAYYDLEANPLFRELMEDCLLRAKDKDAGAAGALTDREASKMHGEAVGLRTMVVRALEIRDARLDYYTNEQMKEHYELGKNTDASDVGQKADSPAGARPQKLQRRSLFADMSSAEIDA